MLYGEKEKKLDQLFINRFHSTTTNIAHVKLLDTLFQEVTHKVSKNIRTDIEKMMIILYGIASKYSIEQCWTFTKKSDQKRFTVIPTLTPIEVFKKYIKHYPTVLSNKIDESIFGTNNIKYIEPYVFDGMDETIKSANYIEQAFHNHLYTYAVYDYTLAVLYTIQQIMNNQDVPKNECDQVFDLLLDLIVACTRRQHYTHRDMFSFAIMSKNQDNIDTVMNIVAEEHFISGDKNCHFSLDENLGEMTQPLSGFRKSYHEDTLRKEIFEYYGKSDLL